MRAHWLAAWIVGGAPLTFWNLDGWPENTGRAAEGFRHSLSAASSLHIQARHCLHPRRPIPQWLRGVGGLPPLSA